MPSSDAPWVCADCGTRRDDTNRCERCGSVRVVLLSAIIEAYGSMHKFEHNIHPASWVLLTAMEHSGEERKKAEEYIWFLERMAGSAYEATLLYQAKLKHLQSCMRCMNQAKCDIGAGIEAHLQELQLVAKLSRDTLSGLQEVHGSGLPDRPRQDSEG